VKSPVSLGGAGTLPTRDRYDLKVVDQLAARAILVCSDLCSRRSLAFADP
jgi:hypothetical protein